MEMCATSVVRRKETIDRTHPDPVLLYLGKSGAGILNLTLKHLYRLIARRLIWVFGSPPDTVMRARLHTLLRSWNGPASMEPIWTEAQTGRQSLRQS